MEQDRLVFLLARVEALEKEVRRLQVSEQSLISLTNGLIRDLTEARLYKETPSS